MTVPDGSQIVPYTIWGNDLKVVLRAETELKLHDVVHDSRPLQVIKTSWVNYVFSDETGNFATIPSRCLFTNIYRLSSLSERSYGENAHPKP